MDMKITQEQYREAAKKLAKMLRDNKLPSVINKISYNMDYIDGKINIRVYTKINEFKLNDVIYIDFEYEDEDRIVKVLKDNNIPFLSEQYQAIRVPLTSFM